MKISRREFMTGGLGVAATYKIGTGTPQQGTPLPGELSRTDIAAESLPISGNVRVLAWNTYLLGTPVHTKPFLEARARLMPEFLRGFDVVGLCEGFKASIREEMIAALRTEYPNVLEGPHTEDGTQPYARLNGEKVNSIRQHVVSNIWRELTSSLRLNGGLVLLTKHQIVNWDVIVYQDSAGVDSMADKGVLYAKLRIPIGGHTDLHVYLHVFLTHLQADDHPVERAGQLENLADLMNAYDDGHPMLAIGDFNVSGASSEYATLLSKMTDCTDLWPQLNPNDPGFTSDSENNFLVDPPERQRIDYVFLRNSEAYQKAQCTSIKVQEFHKEYSIVDILDPIATLRAPQRLAETGGKFQLSDHFALSTELQLTPIALTPKRFWIDAAFTEKYGKYEIKRSLYEHGRYVLLWPKEVGTPKDADIHYVLNRNPLDEDPDPAAGHSVDHKGRPRTVYLNPNRPWAARPPYSLRYTLLHMSGHALGLPHLESGDAVMSEWSEFRDLETLQRDDITALAELYPRRPKTLPPPAATEGDLDRQLQSMLVDLSDTLIYGVPREPSVPTFLVRTTTFHWHNNDDKPEDYDEVLYDLLISVWCGNRELETDSGPCPSVGGFSMHEDGDRTSFLRGTSSIGISLDDLRAGCRIRVSCHTWEVDDWPRGGNDDYGADTQELQLHTLLGVSREYNQDDMNKLYNDFRTNPSRNSRTFSIGTNGWRVDFELNFAGFQDLANWSVAERDRQTKQATARQQFNAAILQTSLESVRKLRQQQEVGVAGGLFRTFSRIHGEYIDDAMKLARLHGLHHSMDSSLTIDRYFVEAYRACYPAPGPTEKREFAAFVEEWILDRHRAYGNQNNLNTLHPTQIRTIAARKTAFELMMEPFETVIRGLDISQSLRFYLGMPPEELDEMAEQLIGEAGTAYYKEAGFSRVRQRPSIPGVNEPSTPADPSPWDRYGRFRVPVGDRERQTFSAQLMSDKLPAKFMQLSTDEKLLFTNVGRLTQSGVIQWKNGNEPVVSAEKLPDLKAEDRDVELRRTTPDGRRALGSNMSEVVLQPFVKGKKRGPSLKISVAQQNTH